MIVQQSIGCCCQMPKVGCTVCRMLRGVAFFRVTCYIAAYRLILLTRAQKEHNNSAYVARKLCINMPNINISRFNRRASSVNLVKGKRSVQVKLTQFKRFLSPKANTFLFRHIRDQLDFEGIYVTIFPLFCVVLIFCLNMSYLTICLYYT